MSKPQLKKNKYIARFSEGVAADSGEVIVTADALEVGAEVVVIDENLEEVADFTGEVEIDGAMVTIEKDAITSLGAEEVVEMAEEEVVVEEEVEMSTEEEKPVEMAEAPTIESYTKEEVDAKMEELYAMIAELKTPTEEPVEMESVQMSEVQVRVNKVNALSRYINNK